MRLQRILVSVALGLAGRALAAQGAAWVVAPRYHSASNVTLFAGRIATRWLVAEELSVALHDNDWALAVGAGPRFQTPHADILAIAGPVVATGNAWYAGVYIVPGLHADPLSTTGTLELFFPITRGERFVYELSHVRILARMTGGFQGGVFYHLVKSADDPAEEEIGPSVRLRFAPGFTLTVDGAWGLRGQPSEVVVTVQWG